MKNHRKFIKIRVKVLQVVTIFYKGHVFKVYFLPRQKRKVQEEQKVSGIFYPISLKETFFRVTFLIPRTKKKLITFANV